MTDAQTRDDFHDEDGNYIPLSDAPVLVFETDKAMSRWMEENAVYRILDREELLMKVKRLQ